MEKGAIRLSDPLNECADSLRWRVIETQAKIILHSGDCNKYSFFFEDEPSKPIKYPCLLGYKNWTVSMVKNYLDEQSHNCKFCMPKIDYNVIRYWEEDSLPFPPKIIHVKQRIEKHWNFVTHLAQKVSNHSKECKHFKKENYKLGCLEILHDNFTRWDDRELREFYETKTNCNF
jgi:hypothetical protein